MLCVGILHQCPELRDAWKRKIQWFTDSPENRELHRIDGVPVVFDLKNFPGHTALQLLQEILKVMNDMNHVLEQFTDRIIFMLMHNDIEWGIEKNKSDHNRAICVENSAFQTKYTERFPRGHWLFLGPGCEEKWHGVHASKADGQWNQVAELMMILDILHFEDQVR